MALKGVVQFDYKAEAPDELTLVVGDVITNIKQVEDGWCEGTLKGKKGMFPDNFVKIETVKAKKKVEVIRRMKVTFAYEPTNDDELRLDVGDIVDVFCDEEEGWAKGQSKGKEGVFPTNFAVVYEPAATATPDPQPQEEVKTEEPAQAPSKKVKGIGFGNIFGDGPIKLRQSSYGEADAEKKMNHEKPVKEIEKSSPATPDKPVGPPIQNAKKSKPVEKCRVMFDYEADHEDELTLVKDDIVIILDKTSQDAGWWLGEIVDEKGKKRRGVFPDNFVAPLPAAEEDSEKPKEAAKENKPAESKPPKSKTENKRSSAILPPAEEKQPASTKSKVKQLTNSLKRPAPQAPPASSKPAHETASEESNDVAVVVSSTKDEQKLTHYKRPGGPKNRRKPDTAGRRERAREAEEELLPEAEAEPEPEPQPEPMEVAEKPAEPQTTPKRDTKRGIQVMPAVGGNDTGGDAPSWLKNLRNRSSQKKPAGSMSVSPNKEEDTSTEPPAATGPAWLTQLKKTKSGTQIGPGRPSMPATSPKPGPTKPITSPTANHTPPPRPPSPERVASSDKLIPTKTQEKEPEANSDQVNDAKVELESKISSKTVKEAKKPPVKQVALQPPKQSEKKPMPSAASKPKPPPPKAKPTLPGAKPAMVSSGTSLDDLKEEIRSLKDAMNAMQVEYRRDFAKLNADLEEERSQRMILQAEVKRLSG